ncbi:hypothetical protein ABHI18_004889 [Aspergillus niger]
MAYCSLDADYQLSKNNSGVEDVQIQDASDADLLFKDNEHPLEYYVQQLANIDEALNI